MKPSQKRFKRMGLRTSSEPAFSRPETSAGKLGEIIAGHLNSAQLAVEYSRPREWVKVQTNAWVTKRKPSLPLTGLMRAGPVHSLPTFLAPSPATLPLLFLFSPTDTHLQLLPVGRVIFLRPTIHISLQVNLQREGFSDTLFCRKQG